MRDFVEGPRLRELTRTFEALPMRIALPSTLCAIALLAGLPSAFAQPVTLEIDLSQATTPISKALYGKNNSTSDRPAVPTPESTWTRIRESGATVLRENSGNNSTKHNWRRKLSSSPDWYNEVVPADWNYEAGTILQKLPGVQIMYGFQLTGWAAKTTAHNWDAWTWRVQHGDKWLNAHQNMTGTGAIANDSLLANGDTPSKARKDGDTNSYLEKWPVDSSVGILKHWFGSGGLGYDRSRFRYWAMDNEPDRSTTSTQVTVSVRGAKSTTSSGTLQLAGLPTDRETFVSHSTNALRSGSVAFTGNQAGLTLPALSITAIRMAVVAQSTGVSARTTVLKPAAKAGIAPTFSVKDQPAGGARRVDAAGRGQTGPVLSLP